MNGIPTFLDSGDKIRFFFEAEAFDSEGRLTVEKALSINKVGHALHDLDPVFEAFSRTPDLAALAGDLEFADPLLLQSMYIFKQPRSVARFPATRTAASSIPSP